MAILKNLLVNGASRFIGKTYFSDVDISGTASLASLSLSGNLSVTGNTTVGGTFGVTGESTFSNWITTANNYGWKSAQGGGWYMKDANYVRSYGKPVLMDHNMFFGTAGDNGYYVKTTGAAKFLSINVPTATISNATISGDLVVNGVIHGNEFIKNIVKAVGGQLYVSPTFQALNSTTVTCTAVTATQLSLTLSDDAINGTDYAGATWYKDSKVMLSGTLTANTTGHTEEIIFSSVPGVITANMSNSNKLQIKLDYNGASTYFKTGTLTTSDVAVMMYQISIPSGTNAGLHPIGIYIKAYGTDNQKSYIDIFGGTSNTPNARLGLLTGLGNMPSGSTINGWGIYTDNGFFKGIVEADGGIIGNWTIGESSMYYSSDTPSSSSIVLAPGGKSASVNIGGSGTSQKSWAFTVKNLFGIDIDGKLYSSGGEIAGWQISSNALLSGTWGTDNSAMLCIGTSNAKSVGGSDSISGWVFTAGANFGVTKTGALYADSAHITGEITADTGYIGGTSGWKIESQKISSATNGTVNTLGADNSLFLATTNLGSNTSIAGRSGSDWRLTVGSNFGVTNTGALYAKEAHISGDITASSGTIGGCSIVNGTLEIPSANITGTLNAAQISAGALSRNLMINTLNPVTTPASQRPRILGQVQDTVVNGTSTISVATHGIKVTNTGAIRTYIRFGNSTGSSGSLNGLEPGHTYTMSFDAKCKLQSSATGTANATTHYFRIMLYDDKTTTGTFKLDQYKNIATLSQANKGQELTARCEFTFTIPDNVTILYFICGSNLTTNSHYAAGDYIELSNIMLQEAAGASAWCPADEDLYAESLNAAKTATNYIFADSSGIKVSYTTNPSNYLQITSDGTKIYKSSTQVASYGSSIILGELASNKTHVEIDADSFDVCSGANTGANSTKLATFGADSVIGDMSARGVSINDKGFKFNNGGVPVFYVGVDYREGLMLFLSDNYSVSSSSTTATIDGKEYYYICQVASDRNVLQVGDNLHLTSDEDDEVLSAADSWNYNDWVISGGKLYISKAEVEGESDSVNYIYSKDANSVADPYCVIGKSVYSTSNPAGIMSLSQGDGCTASGAYSTSVGWRNTSSGMASVSCGNQSKAQGDYSFAGGFMSTASDGYSFAFGYYTTASGGESFDFQQGSSIALGYKNTASGYCSTAFGNRSKASEHYSTAFGHYSTASGYGSTAFGYYTTASNTYSTAFGDYTTASGYYSTAFGYHTTASNNCSTAFGDYTTASGYDSTAFGCRTEATGYYTTAFGYYTKAKMMGQVAIGTYNIEDTYPSSAVHTGGIDYGNYAFIIGNGKNDSNRSNALTVDWKGNVVASGSIRTKNDNIDDALLTAQYPFEIMYCNARKVGGFIFFSLEVFINAPFGSNYPYVFATIASDYVPKNDIEVGIGFNTDGSYNPKGVATWRAYNNGNIDFILQSTGGPYVFLSGFYAYE